MRLLASAPFLFAMLVSAPASAACPTIYQGGSWTWNKTCKNDNSETTYKKTCQFTAYCQTKTGEWRWTTLDMNKYSICDGSAVLNSDGHLTCGWAGRPWTYLEGS